MKDIEPERDMADEDLPQLDPDLVEDDQVLAAAVDAVIERDPAARVLTAEILEHQTCLRAAVERDVWMLALRADELTTERFSELSLVLVKWAFREGRRFPVGPEVSP